MGFVRLALHRHDLSWSTARAAAGNFAPQQEDRESLRSRVRVSEKVRRAGEASAHGVTDHDRAGRSQRAVDVDFGARADRLPHRLP